MLEAQYSYNISNRNDEKQKIKHKLYSAQAVSSEEEKKADPESFSTALFSHLPLKSIWIAYDIVSVCSQVNQK